MGQCDSLLRISIRNCSSTNYASRVASGTVGFSTVVRISIRNCSSTNYASREASGTVGLSS